MPRKKKVDSAGESQEAEAAKPKRAAARRKKAQSAIEPAVAPEHEMTEMSQSEVKSELRAEVKDADHGELLENTAAQSMEPKRSASMADIKSKVQQEEPAKTDAADRHDFLAPEKSGFDLKSAGSESGQSQHHSKWLRTLIYFVISLLVLTAAALVFLNGYYNKLLTDQQNSNSYAQNGQPAPAASAPDASSGQNSVLKLGLANVSDRIKTMLIAGAQKQSPTILRIDQAPGLTLPASANDTLYIKSADQAQSQKVLDFLKQFGLTPKIQQKNDLTDDYALYFAAPLTSMDLSGFTSAVYNATGVTGAAKKYCLILQKYKVAGCNALNATGKQTGTTVATNSQAVIVNLSRAVEFQKASFVPAASGQVEDIRVTLGK